MTRDGQQKKGQVIQYLMSHHSHKGLVDSYGCDTIEEYLEWNYFPSTDNESINMETTDKDCIDDSNSAMSKASVTDMYDIEKKMGAKKIKNCADKAKGKERCHEEADHVVKIVLWVYYIEGLGHNLFSVGQFCDVDLEVAFRKNACFIHNLEGVDLLSGSHDTNLYTISLDDILRSSSICLLSKASKTKSWLWHHRLSHLNFGTLNKLAKDGLARGIPRLKFQKDHLCSACSLGKNKKSSHQPKAEDTNQEKLNLLHMDLCGLMRVASINGKMYILVIVDDYSRFTWVRFMKTKDEAPAAIIKCIKNMQVRLKATVRNVRTDNGTKFVN
ncbi:retrovirus-related pol polyprotein from transposon TNT 1-94 [Tanacetum coccineum]|uniref:Retrovirus-related pol polyprotein from transposon TNT 1-94 n=1 Tax=Tanacetum coccineum TaxID=301880 RepID=A0ABQ5IWS2_9ASTR